MLSDELAKICDQVVAELDELRLSANPPTTSNDFWLHLFSALREIKLSADDYDRAMSHYKSMMATLVHEGTFINTESLEVLGRAMGVWRRAKTREARRTR
jgi:hypothetical protein